MGVVVSEAVPLAVVQVALWFFSASSWVVILYKTWWWWRVQGDVLTAQNAYWQSTDPVQANQALRLLDRHAVLSSLVPPARAGVALSGSGGFAGVERSTHHQQHILQAWRCVTRQVQWGQAWLVCVASVAPCLGLLGTVWGLLDALQALPMTTPDAWSQWVPALSQPLRHTAVGLGVAVPALLAHHLLAPRLQELQQDIDDFAGGLMDQWSPAESA